MAIHYDASEKGDERRGKEWRREAEQLMAGNRAFARWRFINALVFGILAGAGAVAVFVWCVNLPVPAEDNAPMLGRIGGLAFGGALWSYGRSRYSNHCRKIILAAEWEKLKAKEKADGSAVKPDSP